MTTTPPDLSGPWNEILSICIIGGAGLTGAIIRSLTGEPKSLRERVASWTSGAAMAIFGTPVVSPIVFEWLLDMRLVGDHAAISPASVDGLIGLILGSIGLTLVEALIGWARRSIDNMPFPPWGMKK
jgi:hypothetical protein